jgi:methyl-accepting chemotaxis protein
MFHFNNNKKTSVEDVINNYLVNELKRIYKLHENYGFDGDAYLKGNTELEIMINKILELKSSQIREQFLLNSDMIEYITEMNYVKNMVDNIAIQKESVENVSTSSEEMSSAIEDIANYVQNSLITTQEAVSTSKDSIETINLSFKYINESFQDINIVQNKMHNVVDHAKEIDTVVNLINKVAEQTNLLALNASIEAARAGESGRGFAVVADEIKKLAENTKESVNYIKGMVKALSEEISTSEQAMTEAIKVFSKGKEHIDEAVISMNKIDGALSGIGLSFESISANVEEQSAITQEITARFSEIRDQTERLSEACLKTGQGIYTVGNMAEHQRNTALPYFKDFKGSQMLRPIAVEHLLLKWKAYNAACGFVKLDEDNIMDYKSCKLGKYLEHLKSSNPSDTRIQRQYEPHKKVHALSREVVRIINSGDRSKLNDSLRELEEVTSELTKELKE